MPSSLSLHLAGISHHTADVGVREQLMLPPETVGAWLDRERDAGRSLVVVATCNRVELYWWGEHDQEAALHAIAKDRGIALDPRVVYRRDGLPALHHLFLVAAGLDSQVLGEHEILGQLRRAHEDARARGTTTWELEAAFTAALSAGRRVRRETGLGRHPASVASVAVSHAKRCAGGSLADRSILVLGAGEAAEGVLKALEEEPHGQVLVLGRTAERAEALVSCADASVGDWATLPTALARADVVFAATAAAQPVVSTSALVQAVSRTPERPMVVLDLSVPRNVEPSARDVRGVQLFDLDDLQLQHCPVTAGASSVLEQADALIREELGQFRKTLRSRTVAPHLAELHRLGERLASEEADRVLSELGPLSDEQQDLVRQMAERLVRKLLYPASQKIRESL